MSTQRSLPALCGAILVLTIGPAALAQQKTTPSEGPGYRTTSGNQIGTGDRGQGTQEDARRVQAIKQQARQFQQQQKQQQNQTGNKKGD